MIGKSVIKVDLSSYTELALPCYLLLLLLLLLLLMLVLFIIFATIIGDTA
jgi:hypothetical protein